MIGRMKARQLRKEIVKASVSLSDEDALSAVELFQIWSPETVYSVDERIRYEDKLYRCVQGHTSQTGWEPPNVPALWTEVAKPGEIPVWKQPTGAQDAYMTGDKVHFPDKAGPVYVSVMDYNTYAPNVYGWEKEDNG